MTSLYSEIIHDDSWWFNSQFQPYHRPWTMRTPGSPERYCLCSHPEANQTTPISWNLDIHVAKTSMTSAESLLFVGVGVGILYCPLGWSSQKHCVVKAHRQVRVSFGGAVAIPFLSFSFSFPYKWSVFCLLSGISSFSHSLSIFRPIWYSSSAPHPPQLC